MMFYVSLNLLAAWNDEQAIGRLMITPIRTAELG